MDSEKLEKIKENVQLMEQTIRRIKQVEKALADLPTVLDNVQNVGVRIGNVSSAHYCAEVTLADEALIAIVKAGFVDHLETLKSEFKKMKI